MPKEQVVSAFKALHQLIAAFKHITPTSNPILEIELDEHAFNHLKFELSKASCQLMTIHADATDDQCYNLVHSFTWNNIHFTNYSAIENTPSLGWDWSAARFSATSATQGNTLDDYTPVYTQGSAVDFENTLRQYTSTIHPMRDPNARRSVIMDEATALLSLEMITGATIGAARNDTDQ